MRRDQELIDQLLVKLEDYPSEPGDMFIFNGHEAELAIDGYSADQIEYHLGLLKDDGYIDSPGSQPMQGVTFRSLTVRGHDRVDQYRKTLEQKWISAAQAIELLKPSLGEHTARMSICKRAHGQLVRSRVQRLIAGDGAARDNLGRGDHLMIWDSQRGANQIQD